MTPLLTRKNKALAKESCLKETEEKNSLFLKTNSRNVNKHPLDYIFSSSIYLKTETNFKQKHSKLTKAYQLLNHQRFAVSQHSFRVTKFFGIKEPRKQPYYHHNNQTIKNEMRVDNDNDDKKIKEKNSLTCYQLFKIKQQQISLKKDENKNKTKYNERKRKNNKKKVNNSYNVTHKKPSDEFTNRFHDNQILLNKKIANKGTQVIMEINNCNFNENKSNNTNNKMNIIDIDQPTEVKYEIDPFSGYDQFCTPDFNVKGEEVNEEDNSIQEFANENLNVDQDQALNEEKKEAKGEKSQENDDEYKDNQENQRHPKEKVSNNELDINNIPKQSKDRHNNGRLPTISLKNRMMLKMKSIANKRQNRQILVPISTLLDFSAKAAFGSKDIIVKDFQGKIYSAKLSQSSFLFSNTHHSFFIEQNIFGIDNFFIFGVFECEGREGYQIATIAKLNFIYFFSSEFIYNKRKKPTEEDISRKLSENNHHLIKLAFEKIVNDINLTRYDSIKSGVSLSLALVIGKKLICASVGITKPIAMIHKEDNGYEYLNAFEFSSFHSFSTESERKRVELATKGKVTYDQNTNKHSYQTNNNKQINIKLTRALGLKEYRQYGLINEPEINEIAIDNSCKCLFIANQTLYTVLGSTFIMKMLCIGMTQEEAISDTCVKILNSYKKRLQSNHMSSSMVTDSDCVYLIVYFNINN